MCPCLLVLSLGAVELLLVLVVVRGVQVRVLHVVQLARLHHGDDLVEVAEEGGEEGGHAVAVLRRQGDGQRHLGGRVKEL